jgi:hypothetical protein
VESEGRRLGRSGSGMWKAGTFKAVAPVCVGVYGPNKHSSWSPTGSWITPTASLVDSGEKLGTDPWVDQSACCGLCRESFFSGAVKFVQIYRCLAKGCYMWTT